MLLATPYEKAFWTLLTCHFRQPGLNEGLPKAASVSLINTYKVGSFVGLGVRWGSSLGAYVLKQGLCQTAFSPARVLKRNLGLARLCRSQNRIALHRCLRLHSADERETDRGPRPRRISPTITESSGGRWTQPASSRMHRKFAWLLIATSLAAGAIGQQAVQPKVGHIVSYVIQRQPWSTRRKFPRMDV